MRVQIVRKMSHISRISELGILAAFILLIVVFGFLSPYFFTVENLLNIVKQSSINAIIAIGMTMVIISGGIDLSVGSVVALVSVITATLLKSSIPVPISLLIGICVGAVAGMINGFFISKIKIAPFIVTLGSMSYLRGLALVITSGMPIYGVPDSVRWLGNGSIGIFPVPVVIVAIAVVLTTFLLHRTKFGEYTLAIGGNEEATRLSGVNVDKYKILVYIFAGICSSIGSIILMARINAAEPIAGAGFELDAIAAAVMGGTSLSGGVGTVVGTVLGALIIAGLRNGLNLLNVNANWQQVAIGIVIMLAVIVDRVRRR